MSRESFWRVILEFLGLTILILSIFFGAMDELPQNNLSSAFFFLLQIPVGWAALRYRRPSQPISLKAAAQEGAFSLILQAIVLLTTERLAVAFHARDRIVLDSANPPLVILTLTACAVSFLGYRLLIGLWLTWRRLTEKRLLWKIVHTHLVTVVTLILLTVVGAGIVSFNLNTEPYVPSGTLARLVLVFVRAVVPWAGIGIIFALVSIVVFLLPTLITSYLTARPVVQRIHELVSAMRNLRQGDLLTRVIPKGQDEVTQLQDDFNFMAEELQHEREKVAGLLKNQRDLVAVVSHELRTPVTVMRAYIENDLFENTELLPESFRTDLQTILHETLKLQGLIEDLFTLSQIDANRFELNTRWIDGTGVLARVAEVLRKVSWDAKCIELCTEFDPELHHIWADESRLEQVLNNLIQNAIRHTPQGGAILLQARNVEGELMIAVIDSGDGIAPEDLPHVWERFYRGGQGHTGIGLSLVKELIEAMNGTVGVESKLGEGSRFWLRLKTRTVQ